MWPSFGSRPQSRAERQEVRHPRAPATLWRAAGLRSATGPLPHVPGQETDRHTKTVGVAQDRSGPTRFWACRLRVSRVAWATAFSISVSIGERTPGWICIGERLAPRQAELMARKVHSIGIAPLWARSRPAGRRSEDRSTSPPRRSGSRDTHPASVRAAILAAAQGASGARKCRSLSTVNSDRPLAWTLPGDSSPHPHTSLLSQSTLPA